MARGRRNRDPSNNSSISTGSSRRRTRTSRRHPFDDENLAIQEAQTARIFRLAELHGMIPSSSRRSFHHPLRLSPQEEQFNFFDNNQYQENETEINQNSYHPAINHARYHRLQRYALIRQKRSDEWKLLVDQATATYLYGQQITQNWTNLNLPTQLVPYSCSCPPSAISHRPVDLIDISNRYHSFRIPFCECTPHVIRLLHYGFISSSAKLPRTAFSIPLIQLHYELWQAASISSYGFLKGLNSFLESRHKDLLLAQGSTKQHKLLTEGLQYSTNQKWAAKCPRCFGPQKNEQKVNEQEPDFIIAMDGNFQQRHYAHASKDNPSEDQYPPVFLPPSLVNTMAAEVEATEANVGPIEAPCAESHKTADDSRDATTWEKCDDSGLFASACRHDVPLVFTNIYKTGEKLYYPVSILGKIFQDFPQSKIGILYDIGCQLETHIKRRDFFINQQSSLLYGTSVFHAYAHQWSCQVKYNPRLNKWWGLSDGEGLERLWAFMSPLVAPLRVSTRLHRLNAIQTRSNYYTQGLNQSAFEWLNSKLKGAQTVIHDARKALATLHLLPNPNNSTGETYTNNFFQHQWDEEQAYHLETNRSSAKKQEKELGRLLRLEDQLDKEWYVMLHCNLPLITWTHLESSTIRSVESLSAIQAVARARIASNLSSQIAAQREKVGDVMVLLNLTGEQTTLGTAGQQKVLESMRRRAKGLHKVLNEYNQRVEEFVAEFPLRAHPRVIEYGDLMKLEPDDPFWNDDMFTNQNEPWAVDANTQKGIRHLAALNRGIEEKRRIGWEVRRAMRWAVDQHLKLRQIIDAFANPTDCPQLADILGHPILRSLTEAGRISAAKVIIHAAYMKVSNNQIIWNDFCNRLLCETASQTDDQELCTAWSNQMMSLCVPLSQIPGDIDSMEHEPNRTDANQRNLSPQQLGGHEEEEESDDENYRQELEQMVNQDMLDELANEAL
ncbi:hypothetical protein PCASD_04377 [Puccinia coronata f. sp. avenae]|uniref:CxC1-like cysteine cluster associated with KDZ transposases domain-containing protein n=1 Tax=Puccinia coronata f. sp. avenae TaxID=200324 RepID=A0A2N5VCP6_9BASI|nr:hypothetical protein PCASD_04377 [Puccinia coronata f. sp. avenae]